jgi:hypothetical protein
MKLWGITFTVLLLGSNAWSDITDTFRRSNAVVLYEFNDSDTYVRDTADAKFGAPLNLKINPVGAYARSPGVLDLQGVSQVRSEVPAQKIYNQCKASNQMSVEIWLENNENVDQRSGMDDVGILQPLRIVSYATGLKTRNFTIGQVYDGGNMFAAGVSNTDNKGNSLREPLRSTPETTFVPTLSGVTQKQKIIFTFKNGTARIYLTDKEGRLYLHTSGSNDFRGNLDNWDPTAVLTLGNEDVSDFKYLSYGTNYKTCDPKSDAVCGINPNRFWKGKLYLVAVYCKELSQNDIFGSSSLQLVQNPIYQINTNLQITPELRRAQDIYSRLTGVKTPIVNPLLAQMAAKISASDPLAAAALVTENTSDSNFYNITVRDFGAKMSNRDETINTPLNDFTATIVGFVRDELNAQRLLYDDIVYMADPTKAAVPSNPELDYIKSNNHYETLGNERFDLKKVLTATTQNIFNGTTVVANPTPAGLLTSRQWLSAHAIAGTNRRPVEYTLREFLCTPIEKIADSTGPDNVIGRDVDRFPGGSHTKFTTTCRACHTIMDGFRGAFAHLTFSNGVVKHGFVNPPAKDPTEEASTYGMAQNPIYITEKVNHNETVFPGGRIITDDSWTNNAIYGANATTFAWQKTSGNGIKEFGQLIAGSQAFPKCMARRVFQSVCKRDPAASDEPMLSSVATEFSTTRNYNLKYLFQKIVTTKECLGEIK